MQKNVFTADLNLFHLLALSTMALAAVLCYLPVSGADLLSWDTQTYVIDNVAIHRIDTDSLGWMLTRIYHANWHPLTWLSHALDIQLFGFAPVGHHWVNVAWHIACAWMFYFYLQRLLPRLLGGPPGWHPEQVKLGAFIAALLFTVHPQHVESVAWVAERKDLLCAFFYLLSLHAYDRYVDRPGFGRFLLVLVCAAAAIMSKPMAVTLPATLLLLDLLLYRRIQLRFWRAPNWAGVLVEKIPFALLALLGVYLTLQGQGGSGAIGSVDAVPIGQRLANSIVNWVEYPLTTLLPHGLSPFYPHAWEIPWLKLSMCLAAVASLLLLAEFYRRRGIAWPMLALGYYTVTLLPVIGIIQIGAIRAADRYAYLPTLPIYILIALLLLRMLKFHPAQAPGLPATWPRLLLPLALAAVLGVGTHEYSKVWQTDISMWEFVHERESESIHARVFLAESYYAKQDFQRALPLYRSAFADRTWVSPTRRFNIFINRYADTAFRLGHAEEAEIALHTGMTEQRLWFLPPADIYFNAAVINLELARFDTARNLLEAAAANGADGKRVDALRQQIQNRLQNPDLPKSDGATD